jgi:hypothetical protein
MSSINVAGITKEQFGTKMPNVFVDRITLNYLDSLDPAGTPHTEIVATLTIKLTKPDYMQSGTAREFVERHLSNIYLYAYLTYEPWIKDHLNKNELSLEFWHVYGMYRTPDQYPKNRYIKISLMDLVSADNIYESILHVGPNFDDAGNEIVQINNIKVKMNTDAFGEFEIPNLHEIENLMFFTYTGIEASGPFTGPPSERTDDGLFSERFSELDYTTSSDAAHLSHILEKLSSNSYFSDISYYHVLDKNRIATKFFQAYVRPDGTPYFDEVLQSTNGKFYTTDNYSFDNIKTDIEALIEMHNASREADTSLDTNIKNLEAIINASSNKTGVLTQLSNYRATYPDKSPTSLSGTFYAEFVVAFAEILQSVQDQDALDTRLLYDSLVVDNRYGFYTGIYTPPDPSGLLSPEPTSGIRAADVVRGVPYTSPSACYIPNKWMQLARKAFMTDSITSYTDEQLADLYGISSDGAGTFREGFADESETLDRLLDELQAKYVSEGFTTVQARYMAHEELAFEFDTSDRSSVSTGRYTHSYGRTRSELLNPTLNGPATGADSYVDLRSGDALVYNHGTFLFDYEKALRTQSMIAHVFDLEKLQKLFRINIPYENFFVTKVELSRNELRLDATDIASFHDKFLRTKLELSMVTPSVMHTDPAPELEYVDYPKNSINKFKYLGGKDSGEAGSEAEIYAERSKYLRPGFFIGGSSKASTLKFVNWDLARTESARLTNVNNLDDVVENKKLDFEFLEGTDRRYLRVYDGYRLMCFSFFDVMDDDVAYYNTIEVDDEERSTLIETSNNLGERKTCYSITIEVEDQTQLSYDNFVSYIVDVYNSFSEYYGYANDICSFNNITNEFNQFFIDQIEEIFPDSDIWVTAAYLANALGELLFGVTGTEIDTDVFNEKVQETVIKISPRTGNLFQLTAFADQFKAVIDYIVINDLETSSGVGVGTGIATPFNRMKEVFPSDDGEDIGKRKLQFYNEKPIWEPISGDVTPDDIILEDTSVDLSYNALPEFTIPIGTIEAINFTADHDFGPLGGLSIAEAGSYSEDALVRDSVTGAGVIGGELYPDWYGAYESISDFLSSTDSREGVSAYETVSNAAKVVELVYFPSTGPGGPGARMMLSYYHLDSYATSTGLGFFGESETLGEFRDVIVGQLKSKAFFGVKPEGDVTEDAFEAAAPTMAAYWLNKIMKYTTIDVDVDGFPHNANISDPARQFGRLRPGIPEVISGTDSSDANDQIAKRRSYRTVIRCLAVLERLRIAHWRAFSTPGPEEVAGYTSVKFYSAEYRHFNNFFSYYSSAGTDEDFVFDLRNHLMSRSYWTTHELRRILSNVASSALSGDTETALGILESYGLSDFMNPDDPYGPLTGTLGSSKLEHDFSTIEITSLLSEIS